MVVLQNRNLSFKREGLGRRSQTRGAGTRQASGNLKMLSTAVAPPSLGSKAKYWSRVRLQQQQQQQNEYMTQVHPSPSNKCPYAPLCLQSFATVVTRTCTPERSCLHRSNFRRRLLRFGPVWFSSKTSTAPTKRFCPLANWSQYVFAEGLVL